MFYRFFMVMMGLLVCCCGFAGELTDSIPNCAAARLEEINRFSALQSPGSANEQSSSIIENFCLLSQGETDIDEDEKAESIGLFAELMLFNSSDTSSGAFKAMYYSGKAAISLNRITQKEKQTKYFTEHVTEAISVNKSRAKYYSKLTNGKSAFLSRLYMSMEYALIPLSLIMDKWAKKFQQQGLPVLVNDFVSMNNINEASAPLARTSSLDNNGRKALREFLKDFYRGTRKSSRNKDFAMVEKYAILALHQLRNLETIYNCNLSLSVHLVESIGLAARNAQDLGTISDGKTDNFYKAYIMLQNAGIRGFSIIDLKAQEFHRQGVGIIVNDLPAIPFP